MHFILVTGDITVTENNDAYVVFKNCALFSTCKADINDMLVDESNHIYIARPINNLIEYSDNHSDTSGGLQQFKRDKPPANNADLNVNNVVFNSRLIKYKAALLGKTENFVNNTNISVKNAIIFVLMKYLSNF